MENNNTNVNTQLLLTTAQAASILSVGKSTLDQDRLYGKIGLPFVRLGRSIRYRMSDVETYLQNLKAFKSTSEADEAGHDRAIKS